MNRRLLLLIAIVLLSACAQLPNDYGFYEEHASSWTIDQNHARLQNIGVLIQTGKGNDAKLQADQIKPEELTKQQAALFNLYYAQILLNFGEAEQAISKLAVTDAGQLGINDQIKLYQSQAFAYSLTGNLIESAKARIAMDALLTKPEDRKKNQGVILETLGLLPEGIVLNQKSQTLNLPEWMSIAKILASRNKNPASFNAALTKWKSANPDHPGHLYLASVANMPDDSGEMPKVIAVLLPQSGPYQDAAKAVKAGFLAAHSRDNRKPVLHFYDTENGKAADLYQKAITEGAKLVIGPLNKENIQDLANTTTLNVPVLALNHVPNLSKLNLYQFALSPMDDAAEITRKAALDGYKKAVILVPDNDLGKRMSTLITQAWQLQNGIILKKETYNPSKNDFSTAINNLVGLNKSENRNKEAKKAIPDAKSEPQKRNDIEALFLSAYSKEGRLINSQLAQSGGLPVYALPTIYSGLPDSVSDTALNGITFCDTPWLFNGAYSGDLSMMSLRDILNQFPISYIRLVAMGIDAYHLAAKLNTLATEPYAGATGNLSLESDNRIKRNLVCAKFNMGQPDVIGFTRSPTETDFSQPSSKPAITTK